MRTLLPALFLFATACSTSDGRTWFGSHFDAAVWGRALTAQTQKTDQLLLAAVPLAATVALVPFDHKLQKESNEDQTITEGSTANGDGTAAGLAVMAGGLATGEWIAGDDGHAMETLIESFVVADGVTEVLKVAVGRQRPARDSNSSFPSGHTSFAFTMATFLQRRLRDLDDGVLGWLGYLLYLPAAYVGIDRSEANRHYPTDVAFGAFLGIFLTNTVYDAHYGAAGQPGLFGVRGLRVEPDGGPDGGAGAALVWRF